MTSNNSHKDEASSYRRLRQKIRVGQVAMVLGALVAASHWLAHLLIVEGPPGIQDVLVGYPTAAVLILVGAFMAGQSQETKH